MGKARSKYNKKIKIFFSIFLPYQELLYYMKFSAELFWKACVYVYAFFSQYLWQLKRKRIVGISPKNFSLDIQLYFYFCLNWKIRYFLMQMLCYGNFVSSSDTFYRKEFFKKLFICQLKFVCNIFLQKYLIFFQCFGSHKQTTHYWKSEVVNTA